MASLYELCEAYNKNMEEGTKMVLEGVCVLSEKMEKHAEQGVILRNELQEECDKIGVSVEDMLSLHDLLFIKAFEIPDTNEYI